MVAETDEEEFLIESEFLFALRKGDKHHDEAMKILDLCKRGLVKLQVLSSAVIEVKGFTVGRLSWANVSLGLPAVSPSLPLVWAVGALWVTPEPRI